MLRSPYPFEAEIAERFSTGGKVSASPKGEWIRGYLLEFKEDNPYNMWKEYMVFAKYIGVKPGTYTSFKTYMWILKKLGLITPVRREGSSRGFGKTIYAIAEGMENSELWRNPMQAAYPSTDWKTLTPTQKRALREKYKALREERRLAGEE